MRSDLINLDDLGRSASTRCASGDRDGSPDFPPCMATVGYRDVSRNNGVDLDEK